MLAAGSATLLAQAQPQTPPPIPKNPEEELTAAREALRRNADAMSKVALPMSTEPAVHFKA